MTRTAGEPNWLNETETRAWRAYVISKPLLEYRLNRELQDEHDVSLADYEILVRLSERPQHRMRMSELAAEVASSKSRVSHQIARMERAGLVDREPCLGDQRGVWAHMTEVGMELLRKSAPTHVAGVREHLIDLLTEDEMHTLAAVFERMMAHLRGLRG